MSLLETLAALTLMAAGAAVLFPWVNQSLRALERGIDAEQRAIATMQSIRWLDSIDAKTQANGEQKFATFQLQWNFKPTHAEPILLTNGGGQFRAFFGNLYAGEVRVVRNTGEVWFGFSHTVVAYQRRNQASATPF